VAGGGGRGPGRVGGGDRGNRAEAALGQHGEGRRWSYDVRTQAGARRAGGSQVMGDKR
jgi:hypothetical protein